MITRGGRKELRVVGWTAAGGKRRGERKETFCCPAACLRDACVASRLIREGEAVKGERCPLTPDSGVKSCYD